MMTPRIETIEEKILIGMQLTMSLANNRTAELWKNFMSRRSEICFKLTNDLISLQVYQSSHFSDFKETNFFQKWATVEVSHFEDIPIGMQTFMLSAGLYAVFNYKGISTDNNIFQYIFETWLPTSEFTLDDKPHFEILGEKYRNNDPTSEEEIWIPIKLKF